MKNCYIQVQARDIQQHLQSVKTWLDLLEPQANYNMKFSVWREHAQAKSQWEDLSREPLANPEHCTAVLLYEWDPTTDGSSQHQYRTPQGKCYWEPRMRERKNIQAPESRLDCCNSSLSEMKLFSSSMPHSIKQSCQRKKIQHIFNTCTVKAQILIQLAAVCQCSFP